MLYHAITHVLTYACIYIYIYTESHVNQLNQHPWWSHSSSRVDCVRVSKLGKLNEFYNLWWAKQLDFCLQSLDEPLQCDLCLQSLDVVAHPSVLLSVLFSSKDDVHLLVWSICPLSISDKLSPNLRRHGGPKQYWASPEVDKPQGYLQGFGPGNSHFFCVVGTWSPWGKTMCWQHMCYEQWATCCHGLRTYTVHTIFTLSMLHICKRSYISIYIAI